MKKAVSVFLVSLFLFQSVGYFLVFKYRQHEIRREIKRQIIAGLPDEQLVLLKIPDSITQNPNRQFRWIHAGEFNYNGQFYDIARSIHHDGETWFYCISDHDETRLMANLEKQIKNEMEKNRTGKQQKESLQRLLSPFTLSYHSPNFINEFNPLEFNTPASFSLKTWSSPPDLPPPKA